MLDELAYSSEARQDECAISVGFQGMNARIHLSATLMNPRIHQPQLAERALPIKIMETLPQCRRKLTTIKKSARNTRFTVVIFRLVMSYPLKTPAKSPSGEISPRS
jgi:hypothetical protein